MLAAPPDPLGVGALSGVTSVALLVRALSSPSITSRAVIGPFSKASGTQPNGLVAPVASAQTHPGSPPSVSLRGAFR